MTTIPAARPTAPMTTPTTAPTMRPAPPTVVTPMMRPQMLCEGITDTDIRRTRAHRDLITVRPGAYMSAQHAGELWPEDRYRLLIRSSVGRFPTHGAASHVSAAALHRLPLWHVSLDRVHVTRPGTSGTHRSAWLHTHVARGSLTVTDIDNIPVTGAAQTVVDCARIVPFEQAVVIADAALHAKMVTQDELADYLDSIAGCHGVRRARAVVASADGRSESVGESRSRVRLARCDVPAMELQYEIRNDSGIVVARTDFALPELKIAGEFDGKIKYGRLLRPGQEPGDAVFEEKQRQDAVHDAGWDMVRWVWSELDTIAVIEARWGRAISRARARVR